MKILTNPHVGKIIEKIRPCVRASLENGAASDYEYQKMRHSIIAEMKRLGYDLSEIKHHVIEWNARCKSPRDKDRHLLKYIIWFEKHNCRTGCKALYDFCIGQENCWFYLESTNAQASGSDLYYTGFRVRPLLYTNISSIECEIRIFSPA